MSPIEWPKVKLADYVDLLSGFPFKSAGFSTASDDIPLVKGENVHQGFIDWNKAKRWPKNQVEGLDKYWLKPGDVVLAMDRPWIEAGLKQACIREHDPSSLLVQRVSRLRGENGLLTDYLRHLIGSSMFTDYIKPIVTGTSVPHISGAQIKGFEFRLPPPPTQRRIASILSAYDDLIENNTRRIAILEEMARRLYEEWFVRFRFPGHEGVPMVESELGLVPKGWNLKKVNDIVLRLPSGVVYKQVDVLPNGTVPVIDQSTSELLGFHDNLPAHQASAAAPVVIFGDHTCKMQLMVTPFSLGPNTVPFVAKELAVQYVFWVVRGLIKTQEYKRHWSDLMKKSVVVAPVSIAQSFAEQVQSMAEFSEMLKRKNRNLRTTRDLLLPKLISGELDVSTLSEPQAQST